MNMRIYEAARKVPSEAQKAFNNGKFSGTDINPMWRIKMLTELFGPCGLGWYYEVISERSEKLTDDTIIAVVDLNLYIKDGDEWSKPIFGTGGNQLVSKTKNGISTSDEGYKMALTDALSVACKALGIGADVYWGADKTKYTSTTEPPQKPKQAKTQPFEHLPPARPAVEKPKAQMATAEQIDYILANIDYQNYEVATAAFGTDLERMSYKQAEKLIERIRNTEVDTNGEAV